MEYQAVYKQDVDCARQQDELALYRDSNRLNTSCAEAIDNAVKDSNYELYRYDLDTAAQKVIMEYGEERLAWVLAATLQNLEHDGRFSRENKNWGNTFPIPKERSIYYTVKTHPAVLDGFINATRKILAQLEQDTPDKLSRDYHALMEEFDPYGYRDFYEFGHLNVREVSMFEVDSVKKAIKQDAKSMAKGGRDFDTIVEVVTDILEGIPNDRSSLEFKKHTQSLLTRLTAYAGKHHRKQKRSVPKAEKKTSVLGQLEKGKKAASQESEHSKDTVTRDGGREV